MFFKFIQWAGLRTEREREREREKERESAAGRERERDKGWKDREWQRVAM